MKLGILTLATAQGQGGGRPEKQNERFLDDFGNGEGFSTCIDMFAGNADKSFNAFQSDDGLRMAF